MKCPAGHEAQRFEMPHPMTAIPVEFYQCAACVRELRGALWMRMAGFCAGCDQPTWRMLTHPRHGARVLLWPKPETRFARIATPEGPGADIYNEYCPACCPAIGETPARVIAEVNAQPLATAECVGYMERHADLFTLRHGGWLWAHLADPDGYAVSDAERDTWMEQWAQDRQERAEVNSGGAVETPHG